MSNIVVQPEPLVFLRAIREELISDDFLTQGIETGSSPVVLGRSGEALARIAVRFSKLPEIMRSIRPKQVLLLEAVLSALDAAGAGADPEMARAKALADETCLSGIADDIAQYEKLAAAVTTGVKLLFGRPLSTENARTLASISVQACSIENEWRTAFDAAVDDFKKGAQPLTPADRPLGQVTSALITELLRQRYPEHPELIVSNVRQLNGFNTKDIFFVTIEGIEGWPRHSVIRLEPEFNVTGVSLADEFELLNFLKSEGILVPRALMAERDKAPLGGSFILTERLAGAPSAAAALSADGKGIMLELAHQLSAIHNLALPESDCLFPDRARTPRERMLSNVERFYGKWCEDRVEDSLAGELAYVWLKDKVDVVSGDQIVHGDFNLRNILVEGGQVSGILDWELCHLGSGAEDLAYIRSDVEAVLPWEEFLGAYHSRAKRMISDAELQYFNVWSLFWNYTLSSRIYAGFVKGAHKNFMFASVAYIERQWIETELIRTLLRSDNET